jgi:hypothetical protein
MDYVSQLTLLFILQLCPFFRKPSNLHTLPPKFTQLRVSNPLVLEIINIPSHEIAGQQTIHVIS